MLYCIAIGLCIQGKIRVHTLYIIYIAYFLANCCCCVVVVVVRSECVHIVMAIAEILQYLHARTSVLTYVVS